MALAKTCGERMVYGRSIQRMRIINILHKRHWPGDTLQYVSKTVGLSFYKFLQEDRDLANTCPRLDV